MALKPTINAVGDVIFGQEIALFVCKLQKLHFLLFFEPREEERVPDSVELMSGASDDESQEDFDLMSEVDSDDSEMSAFLL